MKLGKILKYCFPGILILLSVILNVIAWFSTSFCDGFRQLVFRKIMAVQGRFSSIFSGSVGELMLAAGVLLVLCYVIFLLGCLIGCIFRKWRKKCIKALGKVSLVYYWIIGFVVLVMTTNCFVLYHCTGFAKLYLPPKADSYTVEDLAVLRAYVSMKANELSDSFERDENGYIIYDKDLKEMAKMEMQNMGEKYPLLAGYQPTPKVFRTSGFFSQQYMLGYYFPFSMEANYNGKMYITNVPATLCHELSHIKGFMYEDEANFIGYLACINSEDPLFQYSGYLSVLDYLNNDLYKSLQYNTSLYMMFPGPNEQVWKDNIFLTKEAWDEVEEEAILDTDTVKEASQTFLETNLNLNGIKEGTASYGKVVELLLEYYYGK